MKRILFPSLAMLAIATVTVVGCNKDDELEEYDTNLDISHNTPTTRSVAEDGFIGDSETIKLQYYKENTSYTKLPSGCGITMLVDIWIRDKGRRYFEVLPSDCPKTAQQYADELLASFGEDYNDSTGISPSNILKVANAGNSTGSYSNKDFSTETDKSTFFAESKNRKKVCGITLYNETTGQGHYAATSSVNSGSVTFTGFDIFNPDKNRYGTWSIPVSGSKTVNKKDGTNGGSWIIKGVYLR